MLKAFLIQMLESLAAGAVQALCMFASNFVYIAVTWVLLPLFGAFTAYRAVRRGLNNYLAWIAPPLCYYLANYLIWGYSPSAGAALVTAFVSLIGAAAGEVRNAQKHTK